MMSATLSYQEMSKKTQADMHSAGHEQTSVFIHELQQTVNHNLQISWCVLGHSGVEVHV